MTAIMPEPKLQLQEPDPSWEIGKHALMAVAARPRRGKTELDLLKRRIPYQWHGGHYQDHDDQPFVLLHNSGGGYVEGDSASFALHAEADTRTLVTTTEATKFYKCENGGTSHESYRMSAGENAVVEYLPDEAIPFARSRVNRRTEIELTSSSRMIASDTLAAGRISYADGEIFKFDSLYSEFAVRVDGRLRMTERVVAAGETVGALRGAWGGHLLSATVVAFAPDLPSELADLVVEQTADIEEAAIGVSVRDRMLVGRVLCSETWRMTEALYDIWAAIRPVIVGKPARRIVKC